MAIHDQEMTTQSPATSSASGLRLIVRAKLRCMRVAAVWQVLMPIARHIESVGVATDQARGYEDITISFASLSSEALEAIVDRLETMPWVTDAVLC